MKQQREVLKQKVVETVQNFVKTEGGISTFDLQILFGNPVESVGCNEIISALRMNGFNPNGSGNKNSG